ncbi:hypothetical protein [Pantoea agglomerans]|uniref:hypothetical protein n=1 Tax=Enterobacter agglomerans TaxID=549 RepID=UPI00241336C0|nr:hypothetical protein [Pantoea agglomerans]
MSEHSVLIETHAFSLESKIRVEYQVFDTQTGMVYAKVTIFNPEPDFNIESREIVQLYTGSFDSKLTLERINQDLSRRNL